MGWSYPRKEWKSSPKRLHQKNNVKWWVSWVPYSFVPDFSKSNICWLVHQSWLMITKPLVTTDASPVGFGAILEQCQTPVTNCLKLNSITLNLKEKPSLWSFFLFLHRTEFEIQTDHKPLITVLGVNSKPPSPSSPRIEWWLLYLQQFCYQVTHIQGKYNSATKVYACSVVSQVVPSALTAKEVELASERDPTLKLLVCDAFASGDWKHLFGTMYKAISDETWVMRQIVMHGNRIIMPESLWKQTLSLAHEGHQDTFRIKGVRKFVRKSWHRTQKRHTLLAPE